MSFTAAAFYRFHPLPRFRELQAPLLAALKALGTKGSVLIAEEGVNGTIAAADDVIAEAVETIRRITGVNDLEAKFSPAAEMPFKRMKVRLKKEIVTIGNVPANPNELVGEYVTPQDWNELISDPDVIVLDTRNDYEFRVGTFRKAVDPQIETFSQFPAWVENHLHDMRGKKIATFCTGGIRCEKATSFMRHAGFEKVYHLKGGILKYLEEIPPEQSLWDGACYVFDERVAVGHGLQQADFTTCHGCLMPVSAEERLSAKYEEGVCCPACADTLSEDQKASNRERQRQFELAKQRGTKHLGPVEG